MKLSRAELLHLEVMAEFANLDGRSELENKYFEQGQRIARYYYELAKQKPGFQDKKNAIRKSWYAKQKAEGSAAYLRMLENSKRGHERLKADPVRLEKKRAQNRAWKAGARARRCWEVA